MADKDIFEETGDKINKDLELEFGDTTNVSEEQLLQAITERVLHLLDRNPELLFSYLYRLDVLEHKIQYALNQQTIVPPHQALAQLILERQKQRIMTKRKFKQEPLKGWGLD